MVNFIAVLSYGLNFLYTFAVTNHRASEDNASFVTII